MTARNAGHRMRDELEAGAGTGLARSTRPFARRQRRRAKTKTTKPARPVTDQRQLCISSVLGHARLDPINTPRDRVIKPSAAAVALATTLAKRATDFSVEVQARPRRSVRRQGCRPARILVSASSTSRPSASERGETDRARHHAKTMHHAALGLLGPRTSPLLQEVQRTPRRESSPGWAQSSEPQGIGM